MKNQLVSIIIPVYNVEKYISRCLDSILTQTYEQLEIIVVNDCTPDNSMTIVEKYAEEDKRIKIINQPQNKGLMRTRNVGVKASIGNYIMFCDSDDWMPSDSVETLLNTALLEDADIVAGYYQRTTSISDFGKNKVQKLSYGNDSRSVFKSLFKYEFSHSLWGKIYKAELLRDHDYLIYDNFTNGEDRLLMFQIIDHSKKTILIEEITYYYFLNSASSTNDRNNFIEKKAINNIILVNNFLLSKFSKDKELMPYLEQNIIMITLNLYRQKIIFPDAFLQEIKLVNSKKLFSYKNLSKCYSGIKLIIFYFIIKKYYLMQHKLN